MELAGAAGSRGFGRAIVPVREVPLRDRVRGTLHQTDWVPDLGARIGSGTWWRGLVTCTGLIAAAVLTNPGIRPIPGFITTSMTGAEREEAHTLSIAPLGLGASTGRRMAANDLVRPLAETPERPTIELTAALGNGDSFGAALQRAGVGRADAARAAALVSSEVALGDLKPGTMLDLRLGRRRDRRTARPLDHLAFRARFDLNLALHREGDGLTMERRPIAIDRTPLRIQGLAGSSLYRSARAAGAPAKLVEAYIKAIAARTSIGAIGADDKFDIIADHARAATGEVQVGQLQYAALDQGSKKLRLVRWEDGDGNGGQFWDANGQSKRQGFMGMPVSGRISSTFGMRRHPLLGFLRMHKGLDLAAPHGTPIYAPIEGRVAMAGRNRGYGNFVKLDHGGGIASGYGHMSRFAVSAGQRVSRGQIIGYVGSTGLSTGPHLHWEVWKNGTNVNPRSISLSSVATLSGEKLRAFKAKVANLLGVPTAR
ncbi:M23 family metallopeptidase [Sphingomonas radiodurans]|uniref:M23 family metallopeptidase n=1 Tax=Sphingomonas radiodurans TaxID=2890321 RepID=UPI001E289C06|nr:M23 family metallopeptidase [Sphingomonas radiodurans]WBH15149.1 M23 family metallopeptidase [Sphingomonas radiodurans]